MGDAENKGGYGSTWPFGTGQTGRPATMSYVAGSSPAFFSSPPPLQNLRGGGVFEISTLGNPA